MKIVRKVAMFISMCCLVAVAVFAGDDTVNVKVAPVEVLTPIEYKPADGKPSNVPPNSDGVTDYKILPDGTWQGQFNPATGKLSFTSFSDVTVTCKVQVTLPDNAGNILKGHENDGHISLIKDEYNRTAEKKIEDAFRGLKEMTFTGDGKTPEEKAKDAEKQANAEYDKRVTIAGESITQQIFTLNKKFDDLTNSGKSATETTADGVKDAIHERNSALIFGEQSWVPEYKEPVFGVGDPPEAVFDSATNLLSFNFPGSGIDFLNNTSPDDPLWGALVNIDPVIVIGPREDGTMHLATTEMTLTQNGNAVLHGYLWELGYEPSNLPGYAGMIQGYLDIPPQFTGAGINNTINSPFLDSLQSFLDTGDNDYRSYISFYTDQPLWDQYGRAVNDRSWGVIKAGSYSIIPEPCSVFLLGFGLLGTALLKGWKD